MLMTTPIQKGKVWNIPKYPLKSDSKIIKIYGVLRSTFYISANLLRFDLFFNDAIW